MRWVVVGYGVQGRKRKHVAGADCVGVVDPRVPDVDWRDIRDVPLDRYDAAFVCTPDDSKVAILTYLAGAGKHALVEKPLHAANDADLTALERVARANGVLIYTAYNHRFEPHYVRMKDELRAGTLGRVYRCRMFYGNGTAQLWRESEWRDVGAGVLPDLGSHLLDTARFWFGDLADDFRVTSASCFENRSPDHVVIASERTRPKIELEMTLLSWRNHFTCDVFGEDGSAHIESLCKWGPSNFVRRTRIRPSGRPVEQTTTLVEPDPTWALEFAHFKQLAADGTRTDLSTDRWLLSTLGRLATEAIAAGGARP